MLSLILAAWTTTWSAAQAAEAGKAPPRFTLPNSLDLTLNTELKTVDSANVVGVIEGADPKLKDEVVVLSAHLDHIGVTEPVKGDAINNGALDNAGGVATTLGWSIRGLGKLGGSPSNTSSAAPATLPASSASSRATSSMIPPRAQLTRKTPSVIRASSPPAIMPRVSGSSGTCRVRMSELSYISLSVAG